MHHNLGNSFKNLLTVKESCGSTAHQNNTYFIDSEIKSRGNTCSLKLSLPDDICQIRMDFVDFSLASPNIEGQCEDEAMIVTSQSSNILPHICGENEGQHGKKQY